MGSAAPGYAGFESTTDRRFLRQAWSPRPAAPTGSGATAVLQRAVGDPSGQASQQAAVVAPGGATEASAEGGTGATGGAVELGSWDRTRAGSAFDAGGGKPVDHTCDAYRSMIRATLGICTLAGEASKECDDACARVRAHSGALMSACGLAPPTVDFVKHLNSGAACGTNAGMGVGKPLPLTNAAEVIHHVTPASRCLLADYEVKRTVEDKTYERVSGAWRQVAATPAGTDDTPGPRADHPECMKPPDLHSFDSPGYVFNTRQLSTGAGKTSVDATGVEVRMNFEEWIAASGPAIRVNSPKVDWSNVLKLRWAGTGWVQEPGSAIGPGHVTV